GYQTHFSTHTRWRRATFLIAAMPRWEQARNKLPTSYLCATGSASVPMLGRALAEPVAPGKPEKLNREVIAGPFLSVRRASFAGRQASSCASGIHCNQYRAPIRFCQLARSGLRCVVLT